MLNGFEISFMDLKVVDFISRPMRIHCDNMTAVFFSKNAKNSGGAKYIELKLEK